MTLVDLRILPGGVPNPPRQPGPTDHRDSRSTSNHRSQISTDSFGVVIPTKDNNVLRLGFQNISGFPVDKSKQKEDTIFTGISTWTFDIFGVAEANLDWRLLPEDSKLHARTKSWWTSLHISHAFNYTRPPIQPLQYGGKAAHRVMDKGQDASGLGHWCWTKYRGRNGQTLRVVSAYRPNPPQGPYSVHAQQSLHHRSTRDSRCPRVAFLEDLSEQIKEWINSGDKLILMLDGNSNMKDSDLSHMFQSHHLQEVLLAKYGMNGPSTFHRNTTRTPIDGIWGSQDLHILSGGYFDYDAVFPNTEHRCLWFDISFVSAFGHNMPAIVRPPARKLHTLDPRLVNNFVKIYKKAILKHNLPQRVQRLEQKTSYPISPDLLQEYETIDQLRMQAVSLAEDKCRKLRRGQVASPPPPSSRLAF